MKAQGGGEDDALSRDFLDFIVCLNAHAVECVLVGGYALAIHGVVRATGDMDFLYRRTENNVQRLCRAMREFGAPSEVVDAEALMTPDIVTQLGQPPHRIDLLNAIDGVSYDEVSKGAEATSVERHPVRVIGLKELKKNKAAAGRKKDKDDLRRLTAQGARKKR